MKAKWKKLWIRALLGGKYKQGEHTLRDGDNNTCCLGVLCDLIDPKGWSSPSPTLGSGVHLHRGEEGIPVNSIMAEAGISSFHARHLAEMNDGGKSFRQIADFVEHFL